MSKNKKYHNHREAHLSELKKKLLSHFREHPDKTIAETNLSRKYASVAGRNEVIKILYQLAAENLIVMIEPGKFRSKELRAAREMGDELTGRVDMTKSGSAYVILDNEEKDIYVPAKFTNKAFDGDIVTVTLLKGGRGRQEGVITNIVKRHRTTFIGVVDRKKHCFVIPDSTKMLVDFFIPEEFSMEAAHGDKVVVEMTDWPNKTRNPNGKITEVLGKAGNNDIEMKSVLVENGFYLSFSNEALEMAEALNNEISEAEIAKRRDFRKITTFTIDPLDAKDFDDAISIQKLENGHWEIGVHIADVSHYVPEGSALDKEALKRATSVYLVDRVAPMFPEQLSNIVCSLRPHEEKLCYAAVFEMDDQANVLNRWFGRTVIYSDKRFVYEEAQEILEGKDGPFKEELHTLNRLAKLLKEKRFKEGSVNFDTKEVRFKLDENSKPIGIYVKERKDAHMLVEDFMLLANKHVAQFAGKEMNANGKVPFVYRVHDYPNEEKLMDFTLFALKFGYKMQWDTPQQISRELNKLMLQLEGKPEQNLLEGLAIRCMAKAVYTTKNIGHYGLGFEFYTHFTSPIRRYPDVMVHRILDKIIHKQSLPSEGILESQCKHSSERERAAADAERASVKYKMAEYMYDHVGEVFTGVISGVKTWGVYVELPAYNCEGMIKMEAFDDDRYIVDEKKMEVRGIFNNKKFSLGDVIKVRLEGVDMEKKTIDFNLP